MMSERSEYDVALSLYSDMYKDTYGFRPTSFPKTLQELDEAIEALGPELELAIEEENERYTRNFQDWKARIAEAAETLEVSFATALRWDFQAEGISLTEIDFYCFTQGIAYSNEDFIRKELDGLD